MNIENIISYVKKRKADAKKKQSFATRREIIIQYGGKIRAYNEIIQLLRKEIVEC